MTTRITFDKGAGLFTYYFILLESIIQFKRQKKLTDKDVLYIDSSSGDGHEFGTKYCNFNVFDHIFKQIKPIKFKQTLTAGKIGQPLKQFKSRKKLYVDTNKTFFTIHPQLLKKTHNFVDKHFIKGKTLGIHVRMTDMFFHHPHHGKIFFKSYVDKINRVCKLHKIDKLFVAADNMESITKLCDIYKNKICFYKTPFRPEKEITGSLKEWRNKCKKDPEYHKDSMIDALLLSHCDFTIGRLSAFNYGSQTFPWCKIQKYYHIQ